MTTINTKDLIGPALDWAVAFAECVATDDTHAPIWWNARDEREPYQPSANWAQGGPIIERERISVMIESYFGPDWCKAAPWFAGTNTEIGNYSHWDNHQSGPTALIAAMRCYVSSKLGPTVDVPQELVP